MEIVNQFPPNIDAIRRRFEMSGFPTAVFAYGDTLYNPTGIEIPADLMAHEETHQKQQAIYGLQDWWTRYLQDDAFRLGQEVEAYQAQVKYAQRNYPREHKRWLLNEIVRNLSSKLYGKIVTKSQAKELINA